MIGMRTRTLFTPSSRESGQGRLIILARNTASKWDVDNVSFRLCCTSGTRGGEARLLVKQQIYANQTRAATDEMGR